MSDNVSSSVGEDLPGGQESEDSIQERLAEMKKKAAQMAASKKAMKREEGHARKNEQKIIDLLLQFLQSKHEDKVIMAVLNALSKNISSNLVVHSLLLIHESLLDDLDIEELEGTEYLQLKDDLAGLKKLSSGQEKNMERAIIQIQNHSSLPPELKLRLGLWMESIYQIALIYPHRTLETFQDEASQNAFKFLLEEILWVYFGSNQIELDRQSELDSLIDNIFLNLLERVTTHLEGVKFISDENEKNL